MSSITVPVLPTGSNKKNVAHQTRWIRVRHSERYPSGHWQSDGMRDCQEFSTRGHSDGKKSHLGQSTRNYLINFWQTASRSGATRQATLVVVRMGLGRLSLSGGGASRSSRDQLGYTLEYTFAQVWGT